ncbi:MAG: hypothetical protein ABID79_00310 [Elusimicrobiota bacterium]
MLGCCTWWLNSPLAGISNKIFTSKYKLQLPDPNILKKEIEQEKQRLLERNIIKDNKYTKGT